MTVFNWEDRSACVHSKLTHWVLETEVSYQLCRSLRVFLLILLHQMIL